MKYKIATIVILALAASAIGQCVTCNQGRCLVPKQTVQYEWRQHQDDPGRRYLYADGKLIGGYDVADQYYRPYDAATDTWGTTLRLAHNTPTGSQQFFGVDNSKLSGQDTYTVHNEDGCRHVSRQEAHKIVGQKLQDDSNKLRITIIGDEKVCRLALADLQALVKDIDDWAIVRSYPPGHWALQPGFVQSGSPTIYCQAPSGKVLHRQDDYQGGCEEAAGALRKAKNSYDAKKDPDLRKSQVQPPDNSKFLSYGIAAVAGAGIMHLAGRRRRLANSSS
jgi:hypothetical protein